MRAAKARLGKAITTLREKERWLSILEPLAEFDPWGDLPYLVGSQAGPQGRRSDLAYREALAKARFEKERAAWDVEILEAEATRVAIAFEKIIATPTPTPLPFIETKPNPPRKVVPLTDTWIYSLVSGRVVNVRIVSVSENVATIEIQVATRLSTGLKAENVEEKATVIEVIDGDTAIFLWEGREEKIRFIGVDTPETKHPTKPTECFAQEAANFTRSLLTPGTSVFLEFDVQKRDRYNRLLAYVFLPDGRMVNEILLAEGYAQVMTIPPNVRYERRFLEAQREARRNAKGLWGKCREEYTDF
jgi:micrococcal nuclease